MIKRILESQLFWIITGVPTVLYVCVLAFIVATN